MCVSLRRYDFVVKLIKNGRREVKSSWTGNNVDHVSQEKVIKLGLHNTLHFPIRLVFEGFPRPGSSPARGSVVPSSRISCLTPGCCIHPVLFLKIVVFGHPCGKILAMGLPWPCRYGPHQKFSYQDMTQHRVGNEITIVMSLSL